MGAALLAIAPRNTTAQDDIAVRFMDAQMRFDWETLAAILHPDFTPDYQKIGEETNGRDAFIARQQARPQPDMQVAYEVRSLAADGDYRHIYAVVTIDMGSASLKAPYVSVIRLQDGLIISGTGGLMTDHLE